jgi:hypothetical protein
MNFLSGRSLAKADECFEVQGPNGRIFWEIFSPMRVFFDV